jgi:hypothetical protein
MSALASLAACLSCRPPPSAGCYCHCRGGAKGNDERDQTLNQMLSEMDGFDNDSQVGRVADLH